MIATLLALVSMVVLGLAVTLALDPRARGPMLFGLAFLYGSATVYVTMLVLSVVGVRWNVVSVTVALLVIAAGLQIAGRGFRGRASGEGRVASGDAEAALPHPEPRNPQPPLATRHSPLAVTADVATLYTLLAYACYATLARLWEWDFWAIWGLKARVFFDRGGIDWRFLESRWNVFAHPDYPLLVPLNYDFLALAQGGWSDRWLGLYFVFCGAALLLVVHALASRELPPLASALVTLALATNAVSSYIGLAEGGLIAYGTAAILMLRRAMRDDDRTLLTHAALLLGFAASCKNEGLTFAVAVALALAVERRWRTLRALWPAAAVIAPWLLLRLVHDLPTDIVAGSTTSRLLARLPIAPQMLLFLARKLVDAGLWAALLVAILLIPSAMRKRERFVFTAVAIQLVFFVGAYLVTPHDPRWHIVTSWPRLTRQVLPSIVFVVAVMLARMIVRGDDLAHAEARPDL